MQVRFTDPARSVSAHRRELDEAIGEVLESGYYILGMQVRNFERELGEFIGGVQAAGVASGTDAIELGLRACGVRAGDEVITQANTCIPTVAAIDRLGAKPVLCDVERTTGCMDLASALAAVGPRTKALVPVHLYGRCADLPALSGAAAERDLALVEDCAQALGAAIDGRRAGTWGQAAAFSFYPTKNLGALGDGGAVTSTDATLVERVRHLRVYGQRDRYHHEEPGVNSRLDEIQAAILRVRLKYLEAGNARRRAIAATYDAALSGSPVRPLADDGQGGNAYHLYVVRAPDRDRMQRDLTRLGVMTLIHYPLAVHQQPSHAHLARGPVPLENAIALAGEVLSLPLYPELTDGEVEHVASAVRTAAENQFQ